MRALIMAGGAGSRLGLGEKPLIPVCDRPMISYVIDAFLAAGCEPVVVASPKTPMTMNWCRAQGIAVVRAGGDGFIEDMIKTVQELEEESPVIVSVSDIPCITPEIILTIIERYRAHVERMPYLHGYRQALSNPAGTVCPTGNRLRVSKHARPELMCSVAIVLIANRMNSRFLLDEPRMALNINTREDLSRAELFFRTLKHGS